MIGVMIKRLYQYKELGEAVLNQLGEEHLHWKRAPEDNSICIIVRHLHGNMRSRFIGFPEADGEKPWRERDDEFNEADADKAALMKLWSEGWDCVFEALNPLGDADLDRITTVRGEPHTVFEALIRQIAHYAYHVGQLVYIGKTIKGKDWQSLSIPKGGSAAYNWEMNRSFPPEKKNPPREG